MLTGTLFQKNINYPFIREETKTWLSQSSVAYTVEKDLEILNDYLNHKGGILINRTAHGFLFSIKENSYWNENPTKSSIIPEFDPVKKYYREKDSKLIEWLKDNFPE